MTFLSTIAHLLLAAAEILADVALRVAFELLLYALGPGCRG